MVIADEFVHLIFLHLVVVVRLTGLCRRYIP